MALERLTVQTPAYLWNWREFTVLVASTQKKKLELVKLGLVANKDNKRGEKIVVTIMSEGETNQGRRESDRKKQPGRDSSSCKKKKKTTSEIIQQHQVGRDVVARLVQHEVDKWTNEQGAKMMEAMKKELDDLKCAMVDTLGKKLKKEIKQEMRDDMKDNVALQRKTEDMVKLHDKRGGFQSHDQLVKEKERIINMAEV